MKLGDMVRIKRRDGTLSANYLYTSIEAYKPESWILIDWGVGQHLAMYVGSDVCRERPEDTFARLLWGDRIVWIETELVENIED